MQRDSDYRRFRGATRAVTLAHGYSSSPLSECYCPRGHGRAIAIEERHTCTHCERRSSPPGFSRADACDGAAARPPARRFRGVPPDRLRQGRGQRPRQGRCAPRVRKTFSPGPIRHGQAARSVSHALSSSSARLESGAYDTYHTSPLPTSSRRRRRSPPDKRRAAAPIQQRRRTFFSGIGSAPRDNRRPRCCLRQGDGKVCVAAHVGLQHWILAGVRRAAWPASTVTQIVGPGVWSTRSELSRDETLPRGLFQRRFYQTRIFAGQVHVMLASICRTSQRIPAAPA